MGDLLGACKVVLASTVECDLEFAMERDEALFAGSFLDVNISLGMHGKTVLEAPLMVSDVAKRIEQRSRPMPVRVV